MEKEIVPSIDDVICFLKEKLVVKNYRAEKAAETDLVKQLGEEYGSTNVHPQYNVGGRWSMKCDVDLFDSNCCGIELKLANKIEKKSTDYERMIGQAVFYSRRRYNDRLIVLVIGRQDCYDGRLKEVGEFIEELGVHFVFKEVV